MCNRITNFDDFLDYFLGHLASHKFSDCGSLTTYLNTSAETRTGDEADIVDRLITEKLIQALGFLDNEMTYNRQKSHSRPDFLVRIKTPLRRVCFVVEDKNTATKDLHVCYAQLKNYMAQTGVPCGMLNNGRTILVYNHSDSDAQTATIAVHLDDAVSAWQGEYLFAKGRIGKKGLEAAGLLPSLSALWVRFNWKNFEELENHINDLTLQKEKNGESQPHKIDGTTWTDEHCRLGITEITEDNTYLLTNAIKELIDEFENEADAQLAAIEEDHKAYLEEAKNTPTYDLPAADQEDVLVKNALALMTVADPKTKNDDELLLRRIIRLETPTTELDLIENRLQKQHGTESSNGKNGKSPIKRAIDEIRIYIGRRRKHLAKLQEQHAGSIRVHGHFEVWKKKTAPLITKSRNEESQRQEFIAQAAYLVIIRILMIRILEDKGLMNRVFTNGGVALWFREVEPHYMQFASGRSTEFLLDMAYTSAQHVYAHFFAERTVLDWYSPDRKAVIRLLHKLAPFDLNKINRDIIGTVYGQHIEAKHKHERGIYFTPPDIVSFMLDRIGYSGPKIIGKKLLDLSCGSGGFLVEAANRLVNAHKKHWEQTEGSIPPDKVQTILDDIRDCIHGIDVNPFACSLAETNLLIQVIDLFKIAYKNGQDQITTIDKFHIYNSDSLLFGDDAQNDQNNALPFQENDLTVEDQIKTARGEWKDGFDYVVGNPPYVRADESSETSEYRRRIQSEHPSTTVRAVMVQKWDLFVPFMAASLELLKNGGKMAMITSNAIEIVPHSETLRNLLISNAVIEEVHFFPRIKLFDDANVQNTITIATRRNPDDGSHTDRFWHMDKPKSGSRASVEKQSLRQLDYRGNIFRQKLPSLAMRNRKQAIPLEDICYITSGMVLNANEKTNQGAFKMEDLIADHPDKLHPAPFVGSKDIDYFGAINLRYLEYGEGTRVPSQIRRATFAELYDRPKLLVARFGGVAYDDGKWTDNGFLKCNHTVIILIPWHHLKDVENKSIGIAPAQRKYQEESSKKIDPWYVLAVLASEQIERQLDGTRRSSISTELQPDDLRQISIPMPSDRTIISKIANLAKRASDIQKKLLPLRTSGWKIDQNNVSAPAIVPEGIPKLSFGKAQVKWNIRIIDKTCRTNDLEQEGCTLRSGKRDALQIPDSAPEHAMEWLRRQLLTLPKGTALGSIDDRTFLVPETPELAAQSLEILIKEEQQTIAMLAEIDSIKNQISELLEGMFIRIEHPPKTQEKLNTRNE